MLLRGKRSKAWLLLLVVIACATLQAGACRNGDDQPLQGQPLREGIIAGEPDEYSATIIRTVEDGASRQVFVTRVARSGGMVREEWSEQGESRALIHRPDLGKSFLLFPDKRIYTDDASLDNANLDNAIPDNASSDDLSPDYINRSLGDMPAPSRVETRTLSAQTIEGYTCAVTEERAEFEDGHAEVTRLFRARDLAGLALRVEVETGNLKIITERRDIRTQVPPDRFNVPADFRKVASRAAR